MSTTDDRVATEVERIKRDVFKGQPVTCGEVAQHLPEDMRRDFWQAQIERFFDEQEATDDH